MKSPLIIFSGLAVLVGVSLATPALATVFIDWASVGNAGNTVDAATGNAYGAVAYDYRIAKSETTIAQYAAFLNAAAAADPYDLYNAEMTTYYINGISRHGSTNNFTYSVNPGSANKPITFVSWFDAARFCNWLHNGQQTGLGAAATTETGAYTLNGAISGVSVSKNAGAKVWIPSENEWYKAAYYDPTKNAGAGGYWEHANQSDTMTTNDIGAAGAANFRDASGGYAIYTGVPSWGITDAGAYGTNSDSYYGTNDQAGNVWEWSDAVSGSGRKLRGGSWGNFESHLNSSFSFAVDPIQSGPDIGFRVAMSAIPEPGSLVALGCLIGSGVFLRSRPKS